MGIKGLTTYIERNKDKYLIDHRLRDTYVVIDGYSLCAQLYRNQAKCNDMFGGDYDKFAKCVEKFFFLLSQCNIRPVVILDGGYEIRKMKTVYSRLENKLLTIQNLNPTNCFSVTVFPLFMREAFKDVLLRLGIPVARCDFEADMEIACVARKLKCPVLSYDSDYFVYDVLYVPFSTLEVQVHKESGSGNYYLKCKLYKVEYFLRNCKINKSLLPLMAALLGNDYISRRVFTKFFRHMKLPKKCARSYQFRTIMALLKWLRAETYESALTKILGRMKLNRRRKITEQIREITEGYLREECEVFDYLNLAPQAGPEDMETDDFSRSDSESEFVENEDSSSSGADSSSEDEEEEEDLPGVEKKEEALGAFRLDTFKENYRRGDISTSYIDLLSLNSVIYTPQVEDLSNSSTVSVAAPLLQAASTILLQHNSPPNHNFFFIARELNRVKKYSLPLLPNKFLPTLWEVQKMPFHPRLSVLLQILNLSQPDVQPLVEIPPDWQLYLMAIIYWGRSAQNLKINTCHISSLIICLMYLSIADIKIPNMRQKHQLSKYAAKIHAKKSTQKLTNDDVATKTEKAPADDCVFFMDAFVCNFTMDEKLKTNRKLFSIEVVDAFAQFQNCLLQIKYLNALLNFPLPSFDISTMYNGTFLYKLYSNLATRSNVDNYIQLLMKDSPWFLRTFKEIMLLLDKLISPVAETGSKKRRKRKKKAKKDAVEKSDEEMSTNENEDNDVLFDANNKFSILATVS